MVYTAAKQPQRSHYAQALATAWTYIGSVAAYWQGNMDEESLARSLDHGLPGRDGQSV